MAKVLITGGSGMIGSRLTTVLLEGGFEVAHLERSAKKSRVETFLWDPEKGKFDSGALRGVDAIVHLAGASIGGKRWTARRKAELVESRIQSTQLLYRELRNDHHQVKTFLCASAVGYYGGDCGAVIRGEGDEPGSDFLAGVCVEWEGAASEIAGLGIRVVRLRTGLVLSPKGGALEPMAKQVRLGVGAPLGNGQQYMSWVHIDDHCAAIRFALEHDAIHGPYNSVAPHPVTNREFTRTLASVLHQPLFVPAIPAFLIRLVLGEMSVLVLGGCNVSSDKLEAAGFKFKYGELPAALQNVLAQEAL